MSRKKIEKILFAIFILLFFVLVSKSGAEEFPGPFTSAYEMTNYEGYCRIHGWGLGLQYGTEEGARKAADAMLYEMKTNPYNNSVEAMTAYAKIVLNYSGSSLQKVIWYSKLFPGNYEQVVDPRSGVAGCPRKAWDYGCVYYGVIKHINGDNLFTIHDNGAQIMVDQEDGTYIVGPYTMTLNIDKSNETLAEAKEPKVEVTKTTNGEYTVYRLNTSDITVQKDKNGNYFVYIPGLHGKPIAVDTIEQMKKIFKDAGYDDVLEEMEDQCKSDAEDTVHKMMYETHDLPNENDIRERVANGTTELREEELRQGLSLLYQQYNSYAENVQREIDDMGHGLWFPGDTDRRNRLESELMRLL